MEHYIFPPTARRKLKAAQEVPQTAYIFGATGYGKTELVKQFLGKHRHIYLSCADGLWDSGVLPPPTEKRDNLATIVVIDDLHRLQSEDKHQEVVSLARLHQAVGYQSLAGFHLQRRSLLRDARPDCSCIETL